MEEEKAVAETPNKKYWNASEIFKILNEEKFTEMVWPFIKAYYKHDIGNELCLHDHKTLSEIYIVIHVDRDMSSITYYYEEDNFESNMDREIKNDRQNLTPENIFDFVYYEYLQFFNVISLYDSIEQTEKPEKTKKVKITL